MRSIVRVVASALLLAVGAAALVGALAARWLETVLLDTDTFIAAVEPVLNDPLVLERTSERISVAISERLDVEELATSQLPPELWPLAAELLVDFDEVIAEQVGAVVTSSAFEQLTVARLRAWHTSFAAAVTARQADVMLEGDTVRVTLGPYIDLLAAQTDAPLLRGALQLVPDEVRQAEVAIMNVRPLVNRLPLMRALSAAGPHLPWVALIALVGGVLIAPRRDWALLGAGVGIAFAGALLGDLVTREAARMEGSLGRSLTASEGVARQAVDTLASPLYAWAMWTVWAGIAVAVVGGVLVLTRRRVSRAGRRRSSSRTSGLRRSS